MLPLPLRYVQRHIEFRSQGIVNIDNQAHNLVTAEKMGIKTYFHDDAKNDVPALIAALRAWGVIVQDLQQELKVQNRSLQLID